ncbi:MAG: hypothetical protein WCK63_00780 [Betaproteobacteria bacterium]
MATTKAFAFLLLAFCTAGSAWSVPVKMLGFDDMSCNSWINSKNENELRRTQLAWVRGVLTGHNYANQRQQVSVISNGTVENFVDRYCSDNPQGEYSDAALRMADKFSGRNEALSK